jgi:uncharacterized membrane protein YqiK
MTIPIALEGALSKQNIRVNVPSRFTIGISTEPSVMQNAAERLLGLSLDAVKELAQEIIFGQLRLVVEQQQQMLLLKLQLLKNFFLTLCFLNFYLPLIR